MLQQVDSSIIHPHKRLESKLKRVENMFHLQAEPVSSAPWWHVMVNNGLNSLRPEGVAFFGTGTDSQASASRGCMRRGGLLRQGNDGEGSSCSSTESKSSPVFLTKVVSVWSWRGAAEEDVDAGRCWWEKEGIQFTLHTGMLMSVFVSCTHADCWWGRLVTPGCVCGCWHGSVTDEWEEDGCIWSGLTQSFLACWTSCSVFFVSTNLWNLLSLVLEVQYQILFLFLP